MNVASGIHLSHVFKAPATHLESEDDDEDDEKGEWKNRKVWTLVWCLWRWWGWGLLWWFLEWGRVKGGVK